MHNFSSQRIIQHVWSSPNCSPILVLSRNWLTFIQPWTMYAVIALHIIINACLNTPLIHFQINVNVRPTVVWRQCLEVLTNNYPLQQLDATQLDTALQHTLCSHANTLPTIKSTTTLHSQNPRDCTLQSHWVCVVWFDVQLSKTIEQPTLLASSFEVL